MRVAIVGGHGKIALQLHPLLVAAGHEPIALVRNEDYRRELEELGAEVRILDIERDGADEFASAFAGAGAVVFTAGGGPDGSIQRKQTVDYEGSLKSAQGARGAGITRFVQVSAINVDQPVAEDASDVWKAYVAAKRDADTALRATELDWTIIRPGRLLDDPATGRVSLGPEVERGDVTRADVAAVLVEVLDRPETFGRQWNLVGGETPIAEAVAAAAATGAA